MAVYLYTPPLWERVNLLIGSLRVKVPTSTTVYRQGGVWHNVQTGGATPAPDECDVWVNDDIPSMRLRLFFTKPMVVPGDLHDELAALEPASDAWSAGTLTLL